MNNQSDEKRFNADIEDAIRLIKPLVADQIRKAPKFGSTSLKLLWKSGNLMRAVTGTELSIQLLDDDESDFTREHLR